MAKSSFALSPVKIKVIGVGGGGCNAVSRMVQEEIRGIEFVAMNTDAQALATNEASIRVQLGERLTRGLGVGGDHTLGQKSAEESRDEIREIVSGTDMVFIAAGMGGGTGTGAAPVVAEIAKQAGALTIAVVTKPFSFEGNHRRSVAEKGVANLLAHSDTLILIPNDNILRMCDQKTGVDRAFMLADDVLRHGVQAITDVIMVPGLINLDFADVKSIMKGAGPAWMSIGYGSGANRAVNAAQEALASPLLDVPVQGATGVMFNVVGNENLTLYEVNQAAEIIRQAVDPDANIIFGVGHADGMDKDVKITLIATGFANSATTGEKTGASFLRNDKLVNSLNELKGSEEQMDLPSFMRLPQFNQRRIVPPPDNQVSKETSESSRREK